jgi:hypothetical protein
MRTGRTGSFAEQALTRLLQKVLCELAHQPAGAEAQPWLQSLARDLTRLRRQLGREREREDDPSTSAFRREPPPS